MTNWEKVIPSPSVPFGGAIKRIEAIRETARIAEILDPKTRTNLRNKASARLGISRRKIEEEYIPDLEARGILLFDGDTYDVNIEPFSIKPEPVKAEEEQLKDLSSEAREAYERFKESRKS